MNDRFLRACRREPVDYTPVWFMRQAGRSLPEYRKIREKHDLLNICKTPELCAEVVMQPVRRLGVDAAVMFADIMLPLEGMGIDFELQDNVGPVIHQPIRQAADVQRLRPVEPEEHLGFVLDAIRLLRQQLDVPLIGFSGAPFTLASYLIEGGASRDFAKTKSFMYREPQAWADLMERLAESMLRYLKAQIAAGAQAIQLFDSWVGCLSPADYREFVLLHTQRIFQGLRDTGVPTIHFAVGASSLLELMKEAGGDAVGVDWRISLDTAWERLGYERAIQGNLDPATLLGPWELVERRAQDVLQRAGGRPGHIFNLGHGVLPDTPVDRLCRLVALVHEYSHQGVTAGEGSSSGR